MRTPVKEPGMAVRIGDYPDVESARFMADEFARREKMPSVVRPFGRL